MAANEVWEFEAYVICTTNNDSGPDIKYTFTVPTGATINWVSTFQDSVNAQSDKQVVTASGTSIVGAISAGTPSCVMRARGIVVNGGTAGNLQFQWAQSSSDTSFTRVQTNSYIKAGKF
jgi:hypothetical protein